MPVFASKYSFCGLQTPRAASRLFRDEKNKNANISSKKLRFVVGDEKYHISREDALNGVASEKQLEYLERQDTICANRINQTIIKINAKAHASRKLNRSDRGASCTKQKGSEPRSSAKSGDGNHADDPDPEPERHRRLYDQQALADLLCVSKKTLQNKFYISPQDFPAAIQIPGARGPRWTPESVQFWLANRAPYHSTPDLVVHRKKVGRPRIAHRLGNGGAK